VWNGHESDKRIYSCAPGEFRKMSATILALLFKLNSNTLKKIRRDMWVHKNCKYNTSNTRGNLNATSMSCLGPPWYVNIPTSKELIVQIDFTQTCNGLDQQRLDISKLNLSAAVMVISHLRRRRNSTVELRWRRRCELAIRRVQLTTTVASTPALILQKKNNSEY